MTWLLTVWMITFDGTTTEVPVGFMVNEEICNIAGAGFRAVLMMEDPRTEVLWRCNYVGAST